MKRYSIVLILGLLVIQINAQSQSVPFESFERTGKVLPTSDSCLIHLVTAAVGDTVMVATAAETPLYGIVKSNKSVNHAVSNLSIEVISYPNTTLFLSYRKGVPKGEGFVGRMIQTHSKEVYLLSFHHQQGYYFQKMPVDKVIAH
ncbi:hypothetical protein [Gynurincola endophyticus]|uniref:hypothetical protein n=1 Tax=Gynurincola endophyticus TaxID=2479004 RepID=UPI000F8D0941|nr:hypothetical protein [Gynurincola endophyticus]